jgi:hypothetical protein
MAVFRLPSTLAPRAEIPLAVLSSPILLLEVPQHQWPFVISDVGGERPGADSSVGRAADQAVERQQPNRCVVMASSQIPKGGLSFSGVAVLKPTLRVRDNRLRSVQNSKAGEQECNDE